MPPTKHRLGSTGPASPGESAARQFTDREAYTSAFDRVLLELTVERPSVLVYYGVGGIGKSSLIGELARRLTVDRSDAVHATLKFEVADVRLPAVALARLRGALHDRYRVPFPTFDVAFALYWKAAYPHLPLGKSELRFLADGELAGDLLAALGDVPLVGTVAKIPRVLDRLHSAGRNWWTRRGMAELRQIAGLDDPNAIAEWLPAFWAADLKTWLADAPTRRAVVFLDTFEALWGGEGDATRAASADDWVREWIAHLDGVLIVVACRSKLRWSDMDASWAAVLEQHLVGGLAPEDADRFLETAGIREPDVRAAIAERGASLPLYLDLAVTTYWKVREAAQRPPRPEEFDQNLGALVDKLWLYLTDAQRAVMLVLSVPETFDRERFAELTREPIATGYPATASGLEALTQFSFIEEVEPGRFAMHALIREALAARHDTGERRRVHGYLFAHVESLLSQLREDPSGGITTRGRRALEEGCEHARVLLDPEHFVGWHYAAVEPFAEAGEWRFLLPISQRVAAYAARVLGPDHPSSIAVSVKLGNVLYQTTRLAEAEQLQRRVTEACARAFGPEDAITIDATCSLARTLARRDISNRTESDEAEELYRGAAELSERVLGLQHPVTLRALNGLAIRFHERGRLAAAEELQRRVVEERTRLLGVEHEETRNALHSLAALLNARGNPGDAEHLYRQVLDATERVRGAEHPLTLNHAVGLAGVLMQLKRYDEAEPLLRRAVDGLEASCGPGHPETLAAQNGFAELLCAAGQLGSAEELLTRILDGCVQALGPKHAYTLTAMNNLATVILKRDRWREAFRLLQTAFFFSDEVLGRDHPVSRDIRRNLEAIHPGF